MSKTNQAETYNQSLRRINRQSINQGNELGRGLPLMNANDQRLENCQDEQCHELAIEKAIERSSAV